MKEKLNTVRSALLDNILLSQGYADTALTETRRINFTHQLSINKVALALIDEIIANLESEELVERVAKGIHDDNPELRYNPTRDAKWEEIKGGQNYYFRTAKAAIAVIKEGK